MNLVIFVFEHVETLNAALQKVDLHILNLAHSNVKAIQSKIEGFRESGFNDLWLSIVNGAIYRSQKFTKLANAKHQNGLMKLEANLINF